MNLFKYWVCYVLSLSICSTLLSQPTFHSLQEAQKTLETYRYQAISSDTSQFTILHQKFEDLGNYFATHDHHTEYARCLYEQTNIEMNWGKSRKAINLLDKKIESWRQNPSIPPKSLAILYTALGFANEREGLYHAALESFDEAINLLENEPDADLELADAYYGKSNIYLEWWDTENAQFYITKTIQSLEQKTSNTFQKYILAKCYSLLGDTYTYQKEGLKIGLAYHSKALKLCQEIFPDKASLFIGFIYNNMALCYWDMHKTKIDPSIAALDSARYLYPKGIEYILHYGGSKHWYLGRSQNNLAMNFFSDWWIDMNQALKKLDPKLISYFNSGNYSKLHKNRALWNQALTLSRYTPVLNQYLKSLTTKKKSLNSKHPYILRNYNNLGSFYLAIGDYTASLQYLQKALCTNLANTKNAIENNIYTLPSYSFKDITVPIQLLSTLKWRGRTLYHQKELENDSNAKKNITIALLENDERMVDLVESLITSYNEQDSKKFQLNRYADIYERGIETAYNLFEKTQDLKYLRKVFWFSEKNKANLSKVLIKENQAIKYLNVEIYQQDSSFRKKISDIQSELLQQKSANLNSVKVKKIENKLTNTIEAYKKFKNNLEENHPTFHNFKYNTQTISSKDIQQNLLANKDSTAIMDYFLGKRDLFITIISRDALSVIKCKTENIADLFQKYRTLISNKDSILNNYEQNYKDFINVSYQLYQLLLEKVEERNLLSKTKQLFIIPHQQLSLIPFETLLTQKVETGNVNFETLPYLIKDYAISYAYSSTLLERALEKKENSNKNTQNYIGFACSNLGEKRSKSDEILESKLRGAKAEVEEAQNILKGQIFIDTAATENAFKNIQESPKILQLAMHTKLDMKEPQKSQFLFCGGDTQEDGNLYAYELYNQAYLLKNVDLAVLTACETGYGPEVKGEGIISLAQTFLHTDCKSILMSQWLVNDESTPKLMKPFFQNLKDGFTKPEALRRAKLQYLEAEHLNHPYYWASCILSGNDNAIVFDEKSGFPKIFSLPFILLIISCLGVFFVRK